MGFFTSILERFSFLEYVSFETQELGNGSTPTGARQKFKGGEGFDIAPTGRRADLLATGGEEEKLNQRKASRCIRRRS
jgi:hypothetical protein